MRIEPTPEVERAAEEAKDVTPLACACGRVVSSPFRLGVIEIQPAAGLQPLEQGIRDLERPVEVLEDFLHRYQVESLRGDGVASAGNHSAEGGGAVAPLHVARVVKRVIRDVGQDPLDIPMGREVSPHPV